MRPVVFAYPPPLAPDVSAQLAEIATLPGLVVVEDGGEGVEGPNPNDVERAAQFLADIAVADAVIVPLTEEACAAVALAQWMRAAELGQKPPGLSCDAILSCLDLTRQVALLRGLRPQSRRVQIGSGRLVFRFRTSTGGSGVTVLEPPHRSLSRLEQLGAADDVSFALIEDYIEGPQWEVTAVVRDQLLDFMPVLRQDDEAYRIEEGAIIANSVRSRCRQVIKRLGLKWCAVNIEVRGPEFKVIDVQCRPGEKPVGDAYHELLTVDGLHPVVRVASAMVATVIG